MSLRRLALPKTLPAGFNRDASCTGALLGRRSSNRAGWGSVVTCKTAHCCMHSKREAAVLCPVDQQDKPLLWQGAGCRCTQTVNSGYISLGLSCASGLIGTGGKACLGIAEDGGREQLEQDQAQCT